MSLFAIFGNVFFLKDFYWFFGAQIDLWNE